MQHCNLINTYLAKGEWLSQRMYLKTLQKEEYMKKVLYVSTIESLMYTIIYKTKYVFCSWHGKLILV